MSLLQTLISQSSAVDDVVCDPFMGSGATGEAAKILGRGFVGGDTSSKAIETARKRLGGM